MGGGGGGGSKGRKEEVGGGGGGGWGWREVKDREERGERWKQTLIWTGAHTFRDDAMSDGFELWLPRPQF